MKDEHFKTQLFGLWMCCPAWAHPATPPGICASNLDNDDVPLSPTLRTALKATSFAGGLLGAGLKSQSPALARMFMLEMIRGAILSALASPSSRRGIQPWTSSGKPWSASRKLTRTTRSLSGIAESPRARV